MTREHFINVNRRESVASNMGTTPMYSSVLRKTSRSSITRQTGILAIVAQQSWRRVSEKLNSRKRAHWMLVEFALPFVRRQLGSTSCTAHNGCDPLFHTRRSGCRPKYMYGQLHGAESFLRRWQSLSYSRNSQTFNGTQTIVTLLTRTRQWHLSWARWTHSTPLHPIPLRLTLIIPSYLCPSPPNSLFPFRFSD